MGPLEVNASLDAYKAFYYNAGLEYVPQEVPEVMKVEAPEQTENNDAGENSNQNGSFNGPAAELILSNQMHSQLRGLALSTRNRMISSSSGKEDGSSGKISRMLERCSALTAKVSSRSLSRGQQTYIQSEIEDIKRQLTCLDVAL